MATKTEYEVDESINAYVKDEETLKQMQTDGQLKPFSNYYTPESGNGSGSASGTLTFDDIYPIGSIYTSTNPKSPAELFGVGTWEQIKDRFLLGAGSTYTEIYKDNGDGTYSGTGGSADAVVVKHSHNWTGSTTTTSGHIHNDNKNWYLEVGSNNVYWYGTVYNSIHQSGVDGIGKNMPPYATVYMWQRVED